MRHPTEGVLRRLLDEPAAVADADREHVAGLPAVPRARWPPCARTPPSSARRWRSRAARTSTSSPRGAPVDGCVRPGTGTRGGAASCQSAPRGAAPSRRRGARRRRRPGRRRDRCRQRLAGDLPDRADRSGQVQHRRSRRRARPERVRRRRGRPRCRRARRPRRDRRGSRDRSRRARGDHPASRCQRRAGLPGGPTR